MNFAPASSVILPESDAVLADIVEAIAQCDPSDVLRIEGHTDNRGSDAYNQNLSESRAIAVKNALIDRGVAKDQLRAFGFGEQRPIASNETEDGMALNRRVAFVSQDAGIADAQ